MDRIEPATAQSPLTWELPDTPDTTPIGTCRVQMRVQPKRRAFSLASYRKAQVHVTDQDVTFVRSTRRLFRRPLETRLTIPRSRIFNVVQVLRQVHFEIHGPSGIQYVALMAKRGDLKNLLGWLPGHATPEHAAEQAALAAHTERLQILTPTTWVTYGLIAINLLVFVAMTASGVDIGKPTAAQTVGWGTNFGPATMSGEWWRLLSSVFVHFGLVHLMVNLFALYQIGRLVERLLGNGRFLALYLFAGLMGSITSVLWHPATNSAGASGAIFGVFGALLVFVVKYRKQLPPSMAKQERTSILMLIGYNLLYGFSHPGIDNGAHLGGLVAGALLAWTLARPLEEPARSAVARKGVIVSAVLALLVLSGPAGVLVLVKKMADQEHQFTQLLQTFEADTQKATDEGLTLLQAPSRTPSERRAVSDSIAQHVVPQWEHLDAAFAATHLRRGSPRTPLREAIVRYLEDNQQLYRLAASQGAQVADAATQARMDALKAGVVEQRVAITAQIANGLGWGK